MSEDRVSAGPRPLAVPTLTYAGMFALLTLMTLLLHGEALSAWWLEDDPQHLLQALRESPAALFFSPERWRLYSASYFVPFLPLAYKIDLTLGGLRPLFFYAHHLLALSVAATLLFAWLRKRLDTPMAFLTAAVFLATPVSVSLARALMVRHYIEGLCFALLALLFWERGGRAGLALSAISYLFAMLCKEIYAPLPLLFLASSIMRRESFRAWSARMIPVGISAAAYIAWRLWILGSLGGYEEPGTIRHLGLLPAKLWTAMTGASPWWLGMVWLAVVMVLMVRSVAANPRFLTGLILIALFVFVPLFQVAETLTIRYAWSLSILATVAVPLLASPIAGWRRGLVTLGLVVIVCAGYLERQRTNQLNSVMVVEGQYLWEQPAEATPLLALSHAWYIDGIRVLRQELGRGPSPAAYMSGFGLTLDGRENFVQFSPGWRFVPGLEPVRRGYRPGALEMNLSITRRQNRLEWSFQPDSSRWFTLTLPGYKAVAVDSSGWGRFPREGFAPSAFMTAPFGAFRVARVERDGSWSVSPEFSFPEDGEVLRWTSSPEASGR